MLAYEEARLRAERDLRTLRLSTEVRRAPGLLRRASNMDVEDEVTADHPRHPA